MNKDQAKGCIKEVKGTVKAATGKAIGNKNLQSKGQVQKALGQAQTEYGDLKEDINKRS